MDIVNVILIEHGRIKDINSFAVVCPKFFEWISNNYKIQKKM